MQREVKIGLAVAAIGLAVFTAVRFGAGPAAKSGLDLALANLPPGWAATHGAVTYNALSGDARVDDLLITHNDEIVFSAAAVLASGIAGVSPTSPPRRIGHITIKNAAGQYARHIGNLEIDGLEVENIRRLIDPAFYPNGKAASDARLPIISRLDGTDITVHVDLPKTPPRPDAPSLTAADIHIAEWHLDSLSLRQFATPPVPHATPDWALIAAFGKNLGYGSMIARDITDTLPGFGRVRIGGEDVTGVQDGRIRSAQLRDMSFDSERTEGPGAVHVSVDRATVRDINFSGTLDALPAIMADGDARNRHVNNSMQIDGFDLTGVRVDPAQGPLMTLGTLTSTNLDQPDGTRAGSATMRGLKLSFTGRNIRPAVALGLQRFGMSDFNIDLDEAGSYNARDGHLKLTQADFNFHGLGALRLNADISGLQNTGANPGDKLALLRAVHLYSASLRWDDASLTDRIFHLLSQQSGKTEMQLRAQLGIPVATLGFMMSEQPDAAAQINAFLDGRHRLIVTFNPPHPPVSFGDVAAAPPTEKAAILGVQIKGQ